MIMSGHECIFFFSNHCYQIMLRSSGHFLYTRRRLVLLQGSGNVDNLKGQYVFLLWAYRALYILNWIYRYFTEPHFSRWIACVAGLFQTALYADFFYYYFLSWKNNAKLQLPA